MKKTTFFILLMTVLLMLLPITALAASETVSYLDENGVEQSHECIVMESGTDYTFESGKWYAVTGSVTISNRIVNDAGTNAPARLILTDGKTLTASLGIHNPDGKGLVIYGQSAGTGELYVPSAPKNSAGIGGNHIESGGNITINSGTVTATGGESGAGIGGGSSGSGGIIKIYGGTVTATGGYGGAGIGGGYNGHGGSITINGGTVTATGGEYGPGIGAGRYATGDQLFFGINPAILKAGPNKDNASDVDADVYKDDNQKYGFVTMSYATASYTVEHWKQKTVRGDDYQKDAEATETHTGFVNNYVEVVSKKYPGYAEPKYTPEKIKADGTTKIVVKYDLIYNTITFNANGHGTAPSPIMAVPGTVISAPENPAEEGFVFKGWYTDEACEDVYTFSTMPAADLTLYAKWLVRFNVIWMLDESTVIDITQVSAGEMPVHDEPVKIGYAFAGWNPAPVPATANTIYTAVFAAMPYRIIWGADQTIFTNADSAVFASNADFNKFVRVEVDGKTVAEKNYTAESGSTVITFNKEYISKLTEGKHTLRIVSTDGSASTGFTVTSLPKTGDQTNPTLLTMLLIASVGTILLISARARKRNED